ncbi:Xylulose kinase [bacterium HR17]|uniref:Xylulose kinase n=1 Tax=Candidatus Fervidibacter japonicus TaxID=2035412 RepID=A0A2H5XCY0_9BACT|nr:Xylulose kinase [bacterium HR17]
MAVRAFLGLDVGTQSVKGRAVDERGNLLAEASTEYPLYIPQPGWTEQEPAEMWQAACATIRKVVEALQRCDPPAEIAAVCATGQMHTMILLDAQKQPLGRALLWNDGRAAQDAERGAALLKAHLGDRYLVETLCNDFLANWTGAHLFYVRNRADEFAKGVRTPETERWFHAWERASTFVTPRDFIVLQLTGEVAMDMCGGSETSLMDIPNKRWALDAFKVLGIDQLQPPPLYEPGTVIGQVTRSAADATGLREGTLVVAGAGDCLAGALAGGVLKVGQVLFTLGTSGVVVAPIGEKPLVDEQLRTQVHFSTVPNVLINMACVNGAGIGLRLFRDVLGDAYRVMAGKLGVDPYDLLTRRAQQAPPGSHGVLFSPYITGDRIVKAPQGRGAWYGLTAFLMEPESKGDACLLRAVLEGVCFAVRDGWEIIRRLLAGVSFEPIRMVGGGSRSPFWCQLTADILGHPVATTTAEDASYGVALLAGVGAGAFSLQEAAERIRIVRVFEPDSALAAFYERFYREVYRGHYDRSQRDLDAAIEQVLRGAEYAAVLRAWSDKPANET